MTRTHVLSLVAAACSLQAAHSYGQTTALSRPADPRALAFGKLLNSKVTADFNANPLKDVVEFLTKVADVDIIANWQTDLKDGLDPEAQVTLQLRNPTSLQTVLELVLSQASESEATWQIGDGFIEIGTKDTFDDNRYTMIYPVGDLIFAFPRFTEAPQLDLESVLSNTGVGGSGGGGGGQSPFQQNNQNQGQGEENVLPESDRADELIEVITTTVEPLHWGESGGKNEIRYYKGSLVVSAADYMHRALAGYPFAPAVANRSARSMSMAPTYVTLSGAWGMSDLVEIDSRPIPVLVGGKVIMSDGDD